MRCRCAPSPFRLEKRRVRPTSNSHQGASSSSIAFTLFTPRPHSIHDLIANSSLFRFLLPLPLSYFPRISEARLRVKRLANLLARPPLLFRARRRICNFPHGQSRKNIDFAPLSLTHHNAKLEIQGQKRRREGSVCLHLCIEETLALLDS